MPRGSKKTKEQLSLLHSDSTWRAKFLQLLDVAALLRESIIRKDYKVPDELNTAIHLTESGQEVMRYLISKQEVPTKEAKLMCFLVAAYENVLIDVDRTNYFVVVDEISKQIKNGEIKHPFVFGRTLYDRAASLFEDQRNYLSVQDTAKLLADSPEGVWQAGELVTGPFGVIRAKTRRSLYPYTDVPLQHCADLSCRHIHRVQLSTDSEAPINLHRWKLTRHLEHNGREPSDWNGFIDDLVRETQSNAVDPDDLHPGSISYLLGDALTDDELRCLFRSIIDNGGTELRQITEMYRKSGPSEKLAASLSRAEVSTAGWE